MSYADLPQQQRTADRLVIQTSMATGDSRVTNNIAASLDDFVA